MLLLIAILLFSITFHEYAHGWVAAKLGDPTAKNAGRLSLNPLAHIDLFGTILLPIILLVSTTLAGRPFTLGYAKPVPINPNYFKNPKKDIKWIGLSGPAANILLAFILMLLIKINFPLQEILIIGALINLILAIFNLIPIPPLDGSRIIISFLPPRLAQNYLKIEPFGFFIILFLIWIGILEWFIYPLASYMFSLFDISILI